MVSTDTRCCGSYMGHRSVALTWPSVVDDRPDRSSRTGRRHRRNVWWCECSSKSIHCSKVHSSHHPRTIGLGSFTRRPVWTRRASHPAPSERPPRGGEKVAWFRYSCEYMLVPRVFYRRLQLFNQEACWRVDVALRVHLAVWRERPRFCPNRANHANHKGKSDGKSPPRIARIARIAR